MLVPKFYPKSYEIVAVAFETATGDRVMVVGNPFSESRIVRIANGDNAYEFELQADSFNTIIFKQ